MVTKGIIKSIDLLGNTCTVHIPFFETAGNDPIIETATVSNTPGSYNGYKVGDVVYVAFEDGSMSTPVIIGKLYLGTEKEKADPRGVINVEESSAAKKASLPADSTLTAEIDENVPNTTVPYSSLSSIANQLNTLNTEVGQMDRDFGNRLVQIFSNAEGMESQFKQAANYMQGNVVKKFDKGSKETSPVEGTDLTTKGLGWHLDNDEWVIKAYDQNTAETLPKDGLEIFKIKRDEIVINAPNVRLAGYPRETIIRYAYSTTEKSYPDLYSNNEINTSQWFILEAGTYPAQEIGNFIWQWTQTISYKYSEENNTWETETKDTVVPFITNENLVELHDTIADTKTELQEDLAEVESNLGTEINNTIAIAQGKTTNYYSDIDPAETGNSNTYGKHLKKGDSWFDTSTRKVLVTPKIDPAVNVATAENPNLAGTFNTKEQYIGYYYNAGSGDSPNPQLVTKDNLDKIQPTITHAYKQEQNCLKQWTDSNWEDIGGELVANKVTANYINALDITAKKVTVIDSTNSGILFDANGLGYDTQGKVVDPYVQIAGFNVKANTLTTGKAEDGNLIKLNSDSQRQYRFDSLTTTSDINKFSSRYLDKHTKYTSTDAFKKAASLWLHENKHYLTYSFSNAIIPSYDPKDAICAVTKVTFIEKITQSFNFYIRDTSLEAADYVIISNLGTDTAPVSWDDTYAKSGANTFNKGPTQLVTVTFEASEAAPIEANNYFYIVYRHASTNKDSTAEGQVYLPVDNIRMSIGDNFQVLADGSVYASNVFLGGITKDPTLTFGSSGDLIQGRLSAVTLTSGGTNTKEKLDDDDLPGVYLGPDGISIGTGFKVEAGGSPIISNVQLTDEQKAELKGDKGAGFVTSVSRPNFAEAAWNTYGTPGHSETWDNTSTSRNGCRIDDIFTVVGTATDTKNAHVLYYRCTNESGNLTGVCLSHSVAERGSQGIGTPGRAVLSTTKYYKLSSLNLASDGNQPDIKNPSDSNSSERNKYWYMSPATFTDGKNYYETVRTIYKEADNTETFEWSVPVKNSMLTVDFINSLGITAKHMSITSKNGDVENTVFTANSETKEVHIGGFTVDAENGSLKSDIVTITPGRMTGDSGSITLHGSANNDSGKWSEVTVLAGGTNAYIEFDGYGSTSSIYLSGISGSGEGGSIYGPRDTESTGAGQQARIYFPRRRWDFDTCVESTDGSRAVETGNIRIRGTVLPAESSANGANYGGSLGSESCLWGALYVKDSKFSAPAGTGSDLKLKNTIAYDISKYDKVFDTLKPVSYKYNDSTSNRTHLGFIAQDIQNSILQADLTTKDYAILTIEGEGFDAATNTVIDEEKTTYRLRYDEFHALEVRQIQLLKQEVKELKAQIEELKKLKTE